MREIKFKAFDKETKKIKYVANINLEDEEVTLVDYDYSINYVEDDYIFRTFHKIEFIQYTGLEDKNGAEIYEGDILKHLTNCEQIGVVSFEKSSFYLTLDEQDGCFYLDNCNEVCEIIGNIYENPELIN